MVILEMSSEIIPNSIISFISAQLTQILGVLITTGNQRNDVLNLMGRTATLTPEVEIESCPDYPHAFPFWNDVPVLLLNHSNVPKCGWKSQHRVEYTKQYIPAVKFILLGIIFRNIVTKFLQSFHDKSFDLGANSKPWSSERNDPGGVNSWISFYQT